MEKIEGFPLNESQKGVYFDCIEHPESTAYNLPFICRLPEGTDIDRFTTAVEKAALTHPALFSTFTIDGEAPRMLPGRMAVRIKRVSVRTEEELTDGFIRPFDLKKGPLYRFVIARTPEGYLFAFDIHHLVFDGTSFKIFLTQISDAYDGNDPEGEEVSLAEFNSREELAGETDTLRADRLFFRERFCEFETDSKPIPDTGISKPSQRAGRIVVRCPQSLGGDVVEAFAAEKGITENILFLSAFARTLSVFSGSNDCCFVTASAGRRHPGIDRTVGMFVRTLPVHIGMKEGATADEYLLDVKENVFSTLRHGSVPFGELAREYGVDTDVSFIYQGQVYVGMNLEGKYCIPDYLVTPDGIAKFGVMVMKEDGGYDIHLDYHKDVYTEGLARSFCDTMIVIAQGLVRGEMPGQMVLTSERSRRFIDSFNDTEKPFDRTMTVGRKLDLAISLNPDRDVVVCGDRHLSYSEFDRLTRNLAAVISARGIGREDFVAVLVGRNEYMEIGSWGAIRCGAAFQPLDPGYPKERLEYMVADSGARLLIADRELRGLLENFTGDVIFTDEIHSLEDAPGFHVESRPGDALTMIYTSGTTGKPKGCVLENHSLVAFQDNCSSLLGIDNTSRIASYASFGFDAGVMDVVAMPMSGATVCIIPDEIRLDLPEIEKFFHENAITHGFMTTQLGRMFAQQTTCSSLKVLMVGGEKLVPFMPPRGFKVINSYGPCETMGYVCYHVVDSDSPLQPVGVASGNTKLFIVDPHGRLLPEGAPGELCISCAQMGRGYLGLPEKTAEVFVSNPFCDPSGPYSRMYRTGDVIRLLPSGELEFIGRHDSQVKIRGFRVELTEVEEVVRRYEGVSDATVKAFDDPAGGKFIAAYVVGPEKIDIDGLEAFIAAEKPSYMVPAVTMQIDAIPYTRNQKVNVRALPKPQRTAGEKVAPENERQRMMSDIVKEILGHEDFGVTTDLFRAGMTSIGLLKFNARLGECLGMPARISDLRDLATIKAIDGFFAGQAAGKVWEKQPDYPLMQNQMGVFIDSGREENSITYNIPMLLGVSTKIDCRRLRDAIRATIDAHPYLKTTLKSDAEGKIRAVRNDDDQPAVEIVTRHALPPVGELVRPFRLLGGRLYRATIYRTDEGNYLFIDVHHIIADGTSMGILVNDINAAMGGAQLSGESFTGFEAALEEESIRSGEKLSEAEAYFDSLLSGCNTDCLPARCPGNEGGKSGCETRRILLEGCSDQVIDFCSRLGLSLNAFFNAAFAYSLCEFIHAGDVSWCTVYNGRGDSRLSKSFAMLVKTLPVCSSPDHSLSPEAFIRSIQEQLVGSMAHDAMSFAEVCVKYGFKPDIFFNYQGDEFFFDSIGGEEARMIMLDTRVSKAPLSVELYLENGTFRADFSFRDSMFCEEMVLALSSVFTSVVKGFTEYTVLKDIPLLSPEEESHFTRMNATDRPFRDVPAHALFEEWAARIPDRTAVRDTSEALTYAELDAKANRIADALTRLGVGADEKVGLILERSVMVPAAEIGILKAGGAFLPMLPTYPDDRLDFCMRDASCRFVISSNSIISTRPELFAQDKPYRVLSLESLVSVGSPVRPETSFKGSQLAYCIYTSGSTGTPKGVMVEQHSLSNFVQTSALVGTEAKGSTILCMASISFDMSITEMLFSLCQGKTLRIASEEEIHNPDRLLAAIEGNGVDMIMMTPSFAWSLLSLPEFEGALSRLNTVVLGAEAFQPALFSRLKALNPDMLIQNGYGPTECTQVCSVKTLATGRDITIGGPFANTRFHILDDFGRLLPRYAAGELAISGEGVCRGYVGLPEKNAAAFLEIDGRRAYRSGDIVRINRDNEAEFGGRRDNQVKLRGFRVELDGVESVMEQFEGITRSKVVVRNNGTEDFLAAFFTADRPVDTEALTAFMKTKLTYYMIPAAMLQLDSMPMTSGGKLDVRALPEISPAKRKSRSGKVPRKSMEQRVLETFRMVLGDEDCFVDDNFFEAGGTSLSASKVVMRLKSEGCRIEYQDIFDHQSAEDLAAFIESREKASAKPDKRTMADSGSDDEYADVLGHNTMEYADEVVRRPLGDVLLTGATGFLGCHILKELLDSENGRILCLLRKGHHESAGERLKAMLFYYFEDRFDDAFGSRISVVEGDITDDTLTEKLGDARFDTLINCAACVKHYSNDSSIEFVNVHGVANLISLTKAKGARMIQISTTSVPGAHTEETYKAHLKMTEDRLFVIDDLNNQYCRSKYRAEKLMLEAIRQGMSGKIIRVGNLMGRHRDGEFQANMHTNAFLNGLRGFVAIGKCPVSHATDPMGFSPIDCTARAVVLLSGTNDCFTAFHADSRWSFDEMKIIEAVNECGIPVIPVKDEEYYADFKRMMGDPKRNSAVSALLTNDRPGLHIVETDNRFTADILYRLGFSWPFVDSEYLRRVVKALDSLGFFII